MEPSHPQRVPRETKPAWNARQAVLWAVTVVLILLCGCGGGSPQEQQEAQEQRRIDDLCAALLLARSPQQESAVIENIVAMAQEGHVAVSSLVQDRTTSTLYKVEQHRLIRQPILLWVRFLLPGSGDDSTGPGALVKFPPRSGDNIDLLARGLALHEQEASPTTNRTP